MAFYEEKENCITLNIRVLPRASKDGIQGIMGDALKIRIQAPPVDGRANMYLVKFLSKEWKVPRASIKILSGETGRHKRVRISEPPDELRVALQTMDKRP